MVQWGGGGGAFAEEKTEGRKKFWGSSQFGPGVHEEGGVFGEAASVCSHCCADHVLPRTVRGTSILGISADTHAMCSIYVALYIQTPHRLQATGCRFRADGSQVSAGVQARPGPNKQPESTPRVCTQALNNTAHAPASASTGVSAAQNTHQHQTPSSTHYWHCRFGV